ncbi:MAG: hypothetical protein ACLQT6_18890 [Desulfomonilaceae bacterium]
MSLLEKLKTLKTKTEEEEKAAAIMKQTKESWESLEVPQMYQQIEQWFKPYIEEGVMEFKTNNISKRDPSSDEGSQLEITMGGKTIIFEPTKLNTITFYIKGKKDKERGYLVKNVDLENKPEWELHSPIQDTQAPRSLRQPKQSHGLTKMCREPLDQNALEKIFERWV